MYTGAHANVPSPALSALYLCSPAPPTVLGIPLAPHCWLYPRRWDGNESRALFLPFGSQM